MDITQEQAEEMKSRSIYEELGISDDSADIKKLVKQDKMAAKKGDAHAQYCLAVRYETEAGVPCDVAKAAYWYEKAAEQGHAQAQYAIGDFYAQGTGVLQDLPVEDRQAKAVYWYTKAAEQGDEGGKQELAKLLKNQHP